MYEQSNLKPSSSLECLRHRDSPKTAPSNNQAVKKATTCDRDKTCLSRRPAYERAGPANPRADSLQANGEGDCGKGKQARTTLCQDEILFIPGMQDAPQEKSTSCVLRTITLISTLFLVAL